MLRWHVLNVTACGGGGFGCYLWTLAGLTASIMRCNLLQSLVSPFWMTEKLGLWPLSLQKCEMSAFRCQGKCSGFCSALFLEATAAVGSGLQLGGFTSELAFSHHLAAPPEPPLAACWALGLCSACVFICSPSPPRKRAYLWFHWLFLVVVLAECLLGSVLSDAFFFRSYFPFSCSWPDLVCVLLSDWKEVMSVLVPGSQGNCF